MRVIYKYMLYPNMDTALSLPPEAVVHHVAVQGDQPHLWIEHDITGAVMTRTFRVYSTGEFVEGEFVGTFMLFDGAFVGHVYEQKVTPI